MICSSHSLLPPCPRVAQTELAQKKMKANQITTLYSTIANNTGERIGKVIELGIAHARLFGNHSELVWRLASLQLE